MTQRMTETFQREYARAWKDADPDTHPHSLYYTVLRNWGRFCFDDEKIAVFVLRTISKGYPWKDDMKTLGAWYGFHVNHAVPGVSEYYIPDVVEIILKENNPALYERYLGYKGIIEPQVE